MSRDHLAAQEVYHATRKEVLWFQFITLVPKHSLNDSRDSDAAKAFQVYDSLLKNSMSRDHLAAQEVYHATRKEVLWFQFITLVPKHSLNDSRDSDAAKAFQVYD